MAQRLPSVSGDTTLVTADSTQVTADRVGRFEAPVGWPCSLVSGTAPSVADKQSTPSADDVLPAVLALTPRGPAWGTDEVGDGQRAAPVMRRVWRAVAAWVADLNAREFEVAVQCFPSAITFALPDWERELALPDPCRASANTVANRIASVQQRFGALGGQSREYFICLAAALGYDIVIEEPTQFFCDESEIIAGDIVEGYLLCDDGRCDDEAETFALFKPPGVYGDEVAGGVTEDYFNCDDGACDDDPVETFAYDPAGIVWADWVVRLASLESTWFRADEGECGADPIEGFLTADDLECVLRAACPPHTRLTFSYVPPAE